MTRTRAAAAAVALLLGGLLLTGCGIKPTGVIESGAAGKVVVPGPGTKGTVYLVASDGRLFPIPEREQPAMSEASLLIRLLVGPTEAQRAAGLETRLPVLDIKKQGASAGTTMISEDTIGVGLPFKVATLSETARQQLVCTVASTEPRYQVVLLGTDADVGPARCELGS
ncbi:hypothetical protein ADK52_32950 [Streptomyces sp. WM6372]|uniref:hypothetical protein n=1 Tax=Streptomyces sp. WM6372 TaxID=1415555 RepID=UPI0006AEFC61|nr:hypothetical protein [Streptomyces sp. WM6372]KOU16896.1 hypothetical protein ADK52_32950 [Streptomyces sp. WM6372]